MENNRYIEQLRSVVEQFTARAREELELRWKRWPLDLSKNDFHEVVGALLARQTSLAVQLAESPPIWNGHVAPIILRAMADVHITVVWIFRDPMNRPKMFIHYGLGQQKLQLEHRRADMKSREPYKGETEHLNSVEQWINSQRAMFLTEVDLGNWSGTTARKMAEEADCLDFYNYVYTPFSACTHSMWHHVALYNLKQCTNPLHRLHAVPHIPDFPLDPHYLYLGAKYLQKTFASFDKETGVSIDGLSALDLVCKAPELVEPFMGGFP